VIDLAALVLTCAPLVAQDTARALIQVESGGNPFAIGVVGGALVRQPANLPEALATVAALEAAGWNYSVGLGQINKRNFERYGLSPATAFEPCANLTAMQGILGECFSRASRRAPKQAALRDAFSCYYSGNFLTGHQHGYVGKVLAAWSSKPLPVRPRHRIRQLRSLAMNFTRHQPSVRPTRRHAPPCRHGAAGRSAQRSPPPTPRWPRPWSRSCVAPRSRATRSWPSRCC
jgi:type IV secretion system protein VirB1